MQTYWTSGVMIPVDAKPGERVFYAKEEVDARVAELEALLRECREQVYNPVYPEDEKALIAKIDSALMER